MTTNKLQLTANILFIAYCIGLVIALTSVNAELKTMVDDRDKQSYTTLKVQPVNDNRTVRIVSSSDYGNKVTVKPAKFYEDCLQCSAGFRNVQPNQHKGAQVFQHASYSH